MDKPSMGKHNTITIINPDPLIIWASMDNSLSHLAPERLCLAGIYTSMIDKACNTAHNFYCFCAIALR